MITAVSLKPVPIVAMSYSVRPSFFHPVFRGDTKANNDQHSTRGAIHFLTTA